MATWRTQVLAWRIPWTEEPGGLQSLRSQRVGHNLATEQQQQQTEIQIQGDGFSHLESLPLSLSYNPSCQSPFPEVSSLSTTCSYEACSITAAIVNASRELFLFFTFVPPITRHIIGTESVLK